MKIGIVTFYRAPNYGAMLQAHALRCFLNAIGHRVVFICHPALVPLRLPLLKCLVSRTIKGLKVKLKNHVCYPMTDFAANYPQTDLCHTLDEVRAATKDCDAFIVGSDQMWNPNGCARSNLRLVMLDFVAEGLPRIAYASSFSATNWREDQNAEFAGDLLRKFAKISVREESGVNLAKDLSGREDIVQMVDPTLLHSANFYRKLIADAGVEIPRHERPTIFRYMLDEWDDAPTSQKAFEFVKRKLNLAEEDSDRIPVRGLLAPICRLLDVMTKVTVPVWLAKIAASDFVFTNSFHGTVFAILFHRPFVSILLHGPMSGMNERALSLLKKFGLESRAAYADDFGSIQKAICSPIDWSQIDALQLASVEDARAFVKECLR